MAYIQILLYRCIVEDYSFMMITEIQMEEFKEDHRYAQDKRRGIFMNKSLLE